MMNDFISVALLGIVLRWSVSFFPYSGAGKPPMYGDYEAQRHWQELTINLPVEEWYKHSDRNDLLYWGLDYPPLTAYHSYICGMIAKYINPDYITLFTSRGYESYNHKLFMRCTVLIMDLIIYIPSAFFIAKSSSHLFKSRSGNFTCFTALVLYPGIYLIDYGHFQYNNVSLGLCIFAVAFIFRNSDILASIFFCLALNYKQMELYHALPFFFFLFGKCLREKTYFLCFKKLLLLGIFVILTFSCCWIPFILNYKTIPHVINRIFPVGRGLYEDKVSNFWCSLSVIFKLKSMFNNTTMALICLVVTLILVMPSSIHLLKYPKPNTFKYSLVNISLIFFLFSFHVHEKSILLATIPACLSLSEEPLIVTWFLIVSVFSMLPLLIRDGLMVPTLALGISLYYLYQTLAKDDTSKFSLSWTSFCKYSFYLSLVGIIVITTATLLIPPPTRYPDLYPVIISLFSCMHYCLFSFYFHYCQFSCVNYDIIKQKSN